MIGRELDISRFDGFINFLLHIFWKGAHPCAALRSRVGAKGCWRHFFKNPTTQLRVDWVLTEKKCEQTPKFACFSVWRRPLHLSQAEMLPSHAVMKEGVKWRRPPPNRKWRGAYLSSHWLIRFTFIFGGCTKPNSVTAISSQPLAKKRCEDVTR